MLQTIVESIVIIATMAGIAYMVGIGIATIAEARVRANLRSERLDERLQKITRMMAKFQKRRDEILPRMIRLDAELKSNRRRNYMISKKVADTQINRSRLLRVLGEEEAFQRKEKPLKKFVAHVINRHVQRAQLEHKEHPNLARSWSRSQKVFVYAANIGDAKLLTEKHFPPATGFSVIDITEPETERMDITPEQELLLLSPRIATR